jgi:hypothetical protein
MIAAAPTLPQDHLPTFHMRRLLILVHGMGSNPPRWSDAVVRKLDALAARYSAFSGGGAPFSKQCTPAEVRYDGVFERYVEEWGASAKEFEKFQRKNNLQLPRLLSWLTDATLPADQKNVFWSTMLDPILYRGFPDVRNEVRAVAMSQIVAHCTANMRGGAIQVSILAHSLGTAVVHDTLQLLASQPQLGNDSFTAKRGWRFENLFMLADVARLGPPALRDLGDDAPDYLVRPRSAGKPGDPSSFYCNRLHSYRHLLDPFVRWAPFVPEWGEDFVSPSPLSVVHAANVHGFDHYLDNPAVHIAIINGVMGYSAITAREAFDAEAEYPHTGAAKCAAEVEQLRALVMGFPDARQAQDLEKIAMMGTEFYVTAQRLGADCKEMARDLMA